MNEKTPEDIAAMVCDSVGLPQTREIWIAWVGAMLRKAEERTLLKVQDKVAAMEELEKKWNDLEAVRQRYYDLRGRLAQAGTDRRKDLENLLRSMGTSESALPYAIDQLERKIDEIGDEMAVKAAESWTKGGWNIK